VETIVQEWGGSLGIRLPDRIVSDFALRSGSIVSVRGAGSEIAVKPARRASLAEMLEQIDEGNIHGEIEAAGPVGKEAW